MAVPFGLSAGDFITTMSLVGTILTALRKTEEARTRYHGLAAELDSLETALLRAKLLESQEISCPGDAVALQQAASRCLETIDHFWGKIHKYHSHLQVSGSGSRFKDGWMKVRWALCTKEDVDEFRVKVKAHTDAIEMLNTSTTRAHTSRAQYRTLVRCIRESSSHSLKRLDLVMKKGSRAVEQGRQLFVMTAKIMRMNHDVFQIMVKIQDLLVQLPPRNPEEQPVYFTDAMNRTASFQLSFINSSEAFLFALKDNFKVVKRDVRKIEQGEFIIEDAGTKRVIDLMGDWNQCFRPGQHVAMSLLVRSQGSFPHEMCSTYELPCPTAHRRETECLNCRVGFQRVPDGPTACDSSLLSTTPNRQLRPASNGYADAELDFRLFRRFSIRGRALGIWTNRRSGAKTFCMICVYREPKSDYSSEADDCDCEGHLGEMLAYRYWDPRKIYRNL